MAFIVFDFPILEVNNVLLALKYYLCFLSLGNDNRNFILMKSNYKTPPKLGIRDLHPQEEETSHYVL